MKTEKKLTAMQEFIICFDLGLTEEEKNYYLEKEKQQIIDAQIESLQTDFYVNYENPEQYYEQYYEQTNKK